MPLPPAMPRWWRRAAGSIGTKKRPCGGITWIVSPGLQVLVDPVGEHAAAHLAHADAQLAVVDAGADRIRAAQVLAVDVAAQRQVLALGEAEHVAQLVPARRTRRSPPRRCRARSRARAAGGSRRRRAGVAQIGLKCSNGSRQARQRYSALHAVEPKADRRSVCGLPQRGQAIGLARGRRCASARRRRRGDGRGGAMPYSRSLRLPGGADPVGGPGRRALQRTSRRGPRPAAVSASSTLLLDHLGGRAAGVGRRQHDLEAVVVVDQRRARCRGRTPTAPALRGRARCRARAQAASMRDAAEIAVTSVLRDRRAAGTASRPGCSPCARCARPRLPCCGTPSRRAARARPRRASLQLGAPRLAQRRPRGPRPLAAASSSTASASNSSAV